MTGNEKPVVDSKDAAPYKAAPWVPPVGSKDVGNPVVASRDAVEDQLAIEAAAREKKLQYARENPNKKLGEHD